MARSRQKRPECPNCGNALHANDNYCARCGQENHTHKLPLRHFFIELLAGIFNFDTKLARTLRDLFVPPGRVIRNFNANQRARYVPPLRLYLFTSVLFFLALGWMPDRQTDRGSAEAPGQQLIPPGSDSSVVESPKGLRFTAGSARIDSVLLARARQGTLTDAVIDSMLVVEGQEPGPFLRRMVRTAVQQNLGGAHRAEFMERFTGNSGKALFFTMPFFALLLYLFNWKDRGFFSEHLVFALYFHVVYFALLLLRLLVNGLAEALGGFSIITAWPLMLLALIHLAWSMRTVYGRPWWLTILKTVVIAFIYAVIVGLGLALTAIVTAAT
ncbi:MAG: DUF3667 domain-containing protein [Flavobacteriales bacterium]|nr:DUF3667 domain-containing protein [Flavobacteriales bacterium]